ncbi:hypothetical protein AMECASPLE_005285 [Ameca splendens]|uniref:Uncharacterized protein n=1 Tax=Ameca splendens TaxID=208324 RepID=A0ABV1A8I6_9TELE
MASCLVPEFPAVLVALEHLKELDRQLREDGVPFSAEGSVHLTAMAAAISELEATRRVTREQLEVETIENSRLRHQINTMSDRMTEDILADGAAARASNAEEIEQLRRDLTLSSQIQEESKEKLHELLGQNKVLQAEREQVRGVHEVIIASLNDQISLRYSRQLQLDQKLEQIEEMRSSIAAAEHEKASLLQSMALTRKAFSEEEENLNGKVDEVVGKIEQQENVIKKSKQELEKVNRKKNETDSRLSELNIQMAQLESSLQRSKASRCYCEQKLQEEVEQSQELNRQIETLKKEHQEQEEAFSLAVRNLQGEIRTVGVKLHEHQSSGLLLKDSLAHICKVFRHRHEEEKEVKADHLRVSLQLERSTLQLEERIACIVKHSKEIREMERQIQELQEEKETNSRVFESKIEEICSDLDAVKSNIAQFKENIKDLNVILEEEKIRQEEYKVKMMSDICSTRRRYEKLLQEESALLQLQPESADTDFLIKRIAQTEKEQRQIQNICQQELLQITTETEKICRSNEEKQRKLEEQETMLKQVEEKWSKVKNRHEELSALHSELNQRRSELELSIQDTEEQTRVLLQPRDDMKTELRKLQESYTDMLNKQNAELRAVEVSIYKHSVMLEQVSAENCRIHLCTRQMMEDIGTSRQETERYQQEVREFNRKAKDLLKDLQEAWKGDISVIEDGERSDNVLLVSINSVSNQLKTRNQQLMNICKLLHQNMLEFSQRLGDKATERQHN